MRTNRRLASFLAVLALAGAAASSTACSAPEEEMSAADEAELRALRAGVDINEALIENTPAGPNAPAVFANVRSWDIRHVELRDPTNPGQPDPTDPFNGFFLIAKDVKGNPLFFNTLAMTDEGIAHFYFSFETDDAGNYLEIPLIATEGDAESVQRVKATTEWLASEKVRLGHVLKDTYADERASMISPVQGVQVQDWAAWRNKVKCVAELAVFALTMTNPIAFFLAQAAVEGGFAIADAVTKSGDATKGGVAAVTNAALGGVGKGVGKAVSAAVTKGKITQGAVNTAKKVGVRAVGVAMVGAVGYQVYKHGVAKGLKEAVKMLIPESCQLAYAEVFATPRNDMQTPR